MPPGAMVKAMRSRLMVVVYLPLGAMMISKPGLQVRAMSGYLVLQQPGSVLMSVAPDAIEGCADSSSLGHFLGPCLGPKAKLPLAIAIWMAFAATWGHGDNKFWTKAIDHVWLCDVRVA